MALAAGALGLLLGRWVTGVLVALMPTDVPRMAAIGINWRVTLFTVVVSLATSVLFGGAAAWPAARHRLAEVLKERPRGSSGRSRLRQGLLVTQSALSMVLLIGAGLLVATLIGLTRVDPGGVTPTDPATLATMAAVLLGVAVAASWIPAREAAGVVTQSTR